MIEVKCSGWQAGLCPALRHLVYGVLQLLRSSVWRLSGSRRISAMGVRLKLHPHSAWLGRRGLSLPRGGPRSRIVAYADLVQAHALCSYLEDAAPAPVVVEVGAYHGAYAVLLGALVRSKGGIVVAIEPEPGNRKILAANVRKNGLEETVVIVECAASDRSGKCSLAPCASQTKMISAIDAEAGIAHSVSVRTLREIIGSVALDHVDVLLVDVEGAELMVLEGFPWDAMMPSRIFCELHPYNWPDFGYQGSDFSGFLETHNLRCVDMYHTEHAVFGGVDYIGPCLLSPR